MWVTLLLCHVLLIKVFIFNLRTKCIRLRMETINQQIKHSRKFPAKKRIESIRIKSCYQVSFQFFNFSISIFYFTTIKCHFYYRYHLETIIYFCTKDFHFSGHMTPFDFKNVQYTVIKRCYIWNDNNISLKIVWNWDK